ncbi:MAG: hypothetical protein V1933_07990 [Candidatus Omnitrophota bacterium]
MDGIIKKIEDVHKDVTAKFGWIIIGANLIFWLAVLVMIITKKDDIPNNA